MKSNILATLVFLFTAAAHADVNCKWIPTFEKPLEEVTALIEQRSGKKPTVSCGAGKDYKVCHSCVDKYSPEDWAKLQEMLAEPQYRNWHTNWHQSELSQENPFYNVIAQQTGRKPVDIHGESFLYMHREMIRALNANAAAMGLPCMNGWSHLPTKADDPEWPTVDAQNLLNDEPICKTATPETISNAATFARQLSRLNNEVQFRVQQELEDAKKLYADNPTKLAEESARIFEAGEAAKAKNRADLLVKLSLTEDQLTAFANCSTRPNMDVINQDFQKTVALTEVEAQPSYLKAHSIGEMGSSVSSSWHGQLHGIYDVSPPHVCNRGDARPYCDNMGSFYSSHVNEHFYKVHGLVDNYIDKWLEQNGYDIAAKDCTGKAKCFQWSASNWSSTPPDFLRGEGCALGAADPLPDPFPVNVRPPSILSSGAGKAKSGSSPKNMSTPAPSLRPLPIQQIPGTEEGVR